MVKVTDKEYYMDAILKNNLNIAVRMVKKDFDFLMVIDGGEGVGKSVLAQQIAYYFDPTLNLDRITFTPKEFSKAILDAAPETCVILDEGFGALSARQSMTMVNKSIVDMLTEIRQKRLFIIIVLPSIFDLDRYVSMWRSRCLVHVYLRGIQRGNFMFFSPKSKKKLLVWGRKTYSYSCVKSDFKGRFTNFYTIDESKYRKKKLESLRSLKVNTATVQKIKAQSLVYALYKDGMNIKKIRKIWSEHEEIVPTEKTLYNWINKCKMKKDKHVM